MFWPVKLSLCHSGKTSHQKEKQRAIAIRCNLYPSTLYAEKVIQPSFQPKFGRKITIFRLGRKNIVLINRKKVCYTCGKLLFHLYLQQSVSRGRGTPGNSWFGCVRPSSPNYSGTPLIRSPSGHGNLVVLTGWSY